MYYYDFVKTSKDPIIFYKRGDANNIYKGCIHKGHLKILGPVPQVKIMLHVR